MQKPSKMEPKGRAAEPLVIPGDSGHQPKDSVLDRHGHEAMRPQASLHFHAQLRTFLLEGARLTPPTLVRALRGAYVEIGRGSDDPFGAALPEARALASVYAAWMETLDPHTHMVEARSVKHLSDAGWIEAQMTVAAQQRQDAGARSAFLARGVTAAVDFIVGDGRTVPQRNDLAWLSGFAAGLQGLSVGHGEAPPPPPPAKRTKEK